MNKKLERNTILLLLIVISCVVTALIDRTILAHSEPEEPYPLPMVGMMEHIGHIGLRLKQKKDI